MKERQIVEGRKNSGRKRKGADEEKEECGRREKQKTW